MTKYTTVQGDTWDIISYKCYGTEKYISLLIEANNKYIETAVFSLGIILNIPDIEESDAAVCVFAPVWRNL